MNKTSSTIIVWTLKLIRGGKMGYDADTISLFDNYVDKYWQD